MWIDTLFKKTVQKNKNALSILDKQLDTNQDTIIPSISLVTVLHTVD